MSLKASSTRHCPIPREATMAFIRPATSRKDLVKVMLAHWAERVKQLRSMWMAEKEMRRG